jgi:RecB family exonuclease
VDWIEFLPDETLHIVDFKTGKREESDGSLQLPIYLLLCNKLRPQWKVSRASYWYLESPGRFVEKELPDAETAFRDVYDVALRVKQAREAGEFKCPKGEGGCIHCRPYEKDPIRSSLSAWNMRGKELMAILSIHKDAG